MRREYVDHWKSRKFTWSLAMLGLTGLSFLLSRYVFFGLHGMKQWPEVMALAAAAVVILAGIRGDRLLSAGAVAGYLGGFILAMIFNRDGVDQGGGTTNNAWFIWTTVFLIAITAGAVGELIKRKGSRDNQG